MLDLHQVHAGVVRNVKGVMAPRVNRRPRRLRHRLLQVEEHRGITSRGLARRRAVGNRAGNRRRTQRERQNKSSEK